MNENILNLVPGDTTTLLSADSVETSEKESNEVHQISTEHLQTLNPANFPPAKLILKKGCIIMLLRNINPEKGLCNGTRLILSTLEYEYTFIITRKHFPVKLSFAMTINKSQGQSLANVGIDLRNPAFTLGQIYVALSRPTNPKGVHILHQSKSDSNPEDKFENVIYPKLLLT
ncbi:hypothetical protein INT48_007135 [Thamnidium elegans]|uniref:DNA helicase n=1 Tax=Thamnidium elegans TaxID=101142 RepID=A0A8H7SSW9_9FUNG|nr:hypothetical protein INT48_007135 [Thamnidium elegans]